MTAREKRSIYKEGFRNEILNAAKELFVTEGYEKFSISNLAKRSRHSPTSIRFYFQDTDALLLAISEEVAGRVLDALTKIRSANGDPLEALRQTLLYLIGFGFTSPDEYRILFLTSSHVYGTLEEFMEKESMARNAYFAFREIVKNCIETGRLLEIDIDVLTQVLTVATRGLAVTVQKTGFPWVDRNVLAHTLVEGLLRGYWR